MRAGCAWSSPLLRRQTKQGLRRIREAPKRYGLQRLIAGKATDIARDLGRSLPTMAASPISTLPGRSQTT
jgi:hypothetical protein